MSVRYPSRDEISYRVFGRKFSQLSVESKEQVIKMYDVIRNEIRSGGDPDSPVRQAAFRETVSIVKQLKEIATNPGDPITLPRGVLQDAARVIHYQSQAVGRGRVLDPKSMAEIKRDIGRKFPHVNPRIVEGITDYLTSTTGRFKGVGSKTLRRKLGSFLTKEELESLSNKEILSARDIVIAHLFDKWSGGNLTSYIAPRLDDILADDLKRMKKREVSSTNAYISPVSKEDLQKTIDALEIIEKYQTTPSRMNSPIVQTALKRLGISPHDIVDDSMKEFVGEVQTAAHLFARKKTGRSTDARLGGGLRRRPRLLTRASQEYLDSIISSYPISGIGKPTTIRAKWSGDSFRTHLPRYLEDSDEGGYSFKSAAEYLESEMADFSSPTAEEEYGNWSKELEKKYRKYIDAGPDLITEYTTRLYSPYVVAATAREAQSQLHQVYHDWYLERMTEHEDVRANYISRYGRYYGRAFHEAGIPFEKADELIMTYGADKAQLKAEIDSYTRGLERYERKIAVEKDEIKPFSPKHSLRGLYQHVTQDDRLMRVVSKFRDRFGLKIADLPQETEDIVKRVAKGEVELPGVKRVGIVGSKSWDNEPFMRKYFSKYWDPNNVMITSTEVGKGLNDTSFGAAYQASNWAHHTGTFQYKIPARVEWLSRKSGKQYQKDYTTADVINSSDEVLAFFDEAYLSPSGISQVNKLIESIGTKPCKIIWVPSKTTRPAGSVAFGSYLMKVFHGEIPSNITIERYNPGALPKEFAGMRFRALATGGKLKPGENAVVGEAGPELLVSRPGGGFDVIPNKHLRFLAEGTLPLASHARNVTREAQPDEHDYVDPVTGEIWPSVTKIKNLGKVYNGGEYYGHVGSVAHYYAAQALGKKYEIDTSHVKFPDISPSKDLQGTLHSIDDIIKTGKDIADRFVELVDQMGFVPSLIEERFVNTRDKYSGTLDIAGFIRDATGNLVPTIADFKTSSKVDADFAEQIAAYADFFQDSVKGFVINVTRDLSTLGAHEMDLVKGFEGWKKKLAKYNEMFGPRPVKGAGMDNAEDAAAMRLFDLASRRVSIYDIVSKERYERQGIGATTPGHARALSKVFPKYGAVGPTPDETWDKNPSRLAVFTERLHELWESASGPGVHPVIKNIISKLESAGWNDKSLAMLAGAPMGGVEDDAATIDLFGKIYQDLKPIGFNQKLLNTGKNLDTMLWNDSIALLNILEEAGKSFESVPRFADKFNTIEKALVPKTVPGPEFRRKSPASTPPSSGTPQKEPRAGDWLFPSSHPRGIPDSIINSDDIDAAIRKSPAKPRPSGKCRGVDLCQPTMSKFESWFNGIKIQVTQYGDSGAKKSRRAAVAAEEEGAPTEPDYEKLFRELYLSELPHPKGWQRIAERLPIIGLPIQMKRKERQYSERVLEAERSGMDWESAAPKGYWKLLEKEDQARKNYLRSIRGATTSYLIAAHVMRIFGQTSKVYNKTHEAIGKGIGYISDMFLMPIIPYIGPVVKGLVNIGNIVRQFPPIFAIGALVIGKTIYETYQWLKAMGKIPESIRHMTSAINDFVNVMKERVVPPKPPTPAPLATTEESEPTMAYRGRMLRRGTLLASGEKPEPDFYVNIEGTAVPVKAGETTVTKPARRFSRGGVVPGVGNTDSVLAMLTPGEVVISKRDIPHYADGGIIGGAGGVIGNIMSMYGTIMSTDIAQSIVGGLGMVSKMVGAMIAPLAPALAIGAVAGRGIEMLRRTIERGNQMVSGVSEGGFRALRTVATAQLLGLVGGLAPLIPIGVAVAGIYAWTQGFGAVAQGLMNTIRGILDAGKGLLQKAIDTLKGMWDWFKDLFKPKEAAAEPGKPKEGDRLRDDKLIESEKERRARARDRYREMMDKGREEIRPEELKRESGLKEEERLRAEKPKSLPERIIGYGKELMKGVPGMTLLGGVLGGMESGDPLEIAKSAALAGAAQMGFNVIAASAPYTAQFLGGFVAPDFGQAVGHAVTRGKGPLSPANYIPGLRDNEMVEGGIRVGVSTALSAGMGPLGMAGAAVSDIVGGIPGIMKYIESGEIPGLAGEVIKSHEIANRPLEGKYGLFGEVFKGTYNWLQGREIQRLEAEPTKPQDTAILNKLTSIDEKLKQPTINQISVEMSNSDPYALFQQFVQWLTTMGKTSGVQVSY